MSRFPKSTEQGDAYPPKSESISDWIIGLDDGFEEVDRVGERIKILRATETGEEIAVKKFPGASGKRTAAQIQEDFMREMTSLVILDHPCLLALKGYCLPAGTKGPKIITEFLGGGSLKDLLSHESLPGNAWWTPTRKAITITGIVMGMKYIHEHGIIHGDLKPGNILFDDEHWVKIADVGSSRL
jgi:serine/threonine protein kinase